MHRAHGPRRASLGLGPGPVTAAQDGDSAEMLYAPSRIASRSQCCVPSPRPRPGPVRPPFCVSSRRGALNVCPHIPTSRPAGDHRAGAARVRVPARAAPLRGSSARQAGVSGCVCSLPPALRLLPSPGPVPAAWRGRSRAVIRGRAGRPSLSPRRWWEALWGGLGAGFGRVRRSGWAPSQLCPLGRCDSAQKSASRVGEPGAPGNRNQNDMHRNHQNLSRNLWHLLAADVWRCGPPPAAA